jgi:hypothetical protein
MNKARAGRAWYFIDEAGDPNFYGKGNRLIVGEKGCSRVFILGFAEILDPVPIRHELKHLQQSVINNPYFHKKPYIDRTAIAFHAKDDLPEVRYLVFDLIRTFDVRAEFIVARKRKDIFLERDKNKQNNFYDHLVSCLFERTLRRHEDNLLYFSQRGSKKRQRPLVEAIEKGIERNKQWQNGSCTTQWSIQAQLPSGEPCLSVVDYLCYAVYQAYENRDMRFFEAIRDKISVVGDIYDHEAEVRWYNRRNKPFHIEKTTPLKLHSETE